MTATTRDLLGLITAVLGIIIPSAIALRYAIKGD